MSSRLQWCIQISVKHRRWSVLSKRWLFFKKHILDVWHGSQYTSGLLELFCCGSQRDTRDCYKQKYGVLFFTCIKLVAYVLAFACAIARIKWKRLVVPIHKRGDKQTLRNYHPVSLLPICSKIFERLLYNEMFGFFLDKGLISANQSGFKPGDSCINQLLSIMHNIYKSFDNGYEVRCFLTFQKHLIKCGMMILYSNYKKMEYQVTY